MPYFSRIKSHLLLLEKNRWLTNYSHGNFINVGTVKCLIWNIRIKGVIYEKNVIYFEFSFLSIFLLIACAVGREGIKSENQTTQTQQQATVKLNCCRSRSADFTLQSMDGKEVI